MMLQNFLSNPQPLILFFSIVVITIMVATITKKYIEKKIITNALEHHIDTTSFIFISHLITSVIYLVGFGWALLALPITNTFAQSLFAGAGVSSLILGFASQQLFTNLISGIYLIIVRPFKVGDTITVQNNTGKVAEITLNSTIIIDTNEDKIIIPSSQIISNPIKIIT